VTATGVRGAGLRYDEPQGRWVLLATVLGSGMAFLDGTVVNVALPSIGDSLDTDIAGLQWTINAYTLTLASFILLGGSAGDRWGRRRMFVLGTIGFAAASLLCGIAPNIETLVVARALQGIAGALLTPGSLAILQSSYRMEDRGRAIGAWSGLAGIAGAVGPFLGGWLVEAVSWRLVFLINVPLAVAVVLVALRHVPESRDPAEVEGFDLAGASLTVLALVGVSYGLVAWGSDGLDSVMAWLPLVLGVLAAVAFVVVEQRSPHPMLPLDVFSSRLFTVVNVVTFLVYAALGGIFFMLVLTLQVAAGFTPLQAGTALLPITVVMLLLSERAGVLAQRIGPRIPMTVGPLLSAAGTLLLLRIDTDTSWALDVLPAVTLFGLGLSATVAPLTTTVLAAAPDEHAGVASGVNNAVARTAGLLVVAALPALVGLDAVAYDQPSAMLDAFQGSVLVCAALLVVGAVLSALLVRPDALAPSADDQAAPAPEAPCRRHCSVNAPPLQPNERPAA
jgi:EmrB/QacA subfamily drug resistance transporter